MGRSSPRHLLGHHQVRPVMGTTWRVTSIEVVKRGGNIKLHCYNKVGRFINTLDCIDENDAQQRVAELETAQSSKITII